MSDRGGRPPQPDDLLLIGILGRPHGVRGEISLRLHNPDSDLFEHVQAPFSLWLSAAEGQAPDEIVVERVRATADRHLLRLRDVNDRDQAAHLTNREVLADRGDLGELNDDEFYVQDVVGCAVFDQDGLPRGEVADVFDNGAHHVVTIRTPDGGETMLPLVPEYILQMDTIGQRLQMTFHDEEEIVAAGDEKTGQDPDRGPAS